MTDDDGYIPGYGFYIPDTQKQQDYQESVIQRVAAAIKKADEVWFRFNKDTDLFECCVGDTDPELPEADRTYRVLTTCITWNDADKEADRLTLENMARAAINAMLATR